jgi:hypothetical protein
MSATASLPLRPENLPSVAANDRFLGMLNGIRTVVEFAFRRHPGHRRQELFDEVVGSAYVMFCRLVELRKEHLAYPSVLAWIAIRQIRAGRHTGLHRTATDVLSPFAQRRQGFQVRSLGEHDTRGNWQDLIADDRRASPADVVSFKLDFTEWLRRLGPRPRAIALDLANGHRAKDIGRPQARWRAGSVS